MRCPQLTAEADVVQPGIAFRTVADLVTWAEAQEHVPGEEWLLALFLDPHARLLGVHELYRGPHCAVRELIDVDAMLDEARQAHTTDLVFMRYHDHRWSPNPSDGSRLEALGKQMDTAGIPLQLHVILDATGRVYPFRLRHGDPEGGGRIGALRLTSVPT